MFKYGVFSGPQGYYQKRKLFRTNSFVLAHSSAKKIYNEQLTLKYCVSLRVQSERGKIQTRKNSVFGHFSHSVSIDHYFVRVNPSNHLVNLRHDKQYNSGTIFNDDCFNVKMKLSLDSGRKLNVHKTFFDTRYLRNISYTFSLHPVS